MRPETAIQMIEAHLTLVLMRVSYYESQENSLRNQAYEERRRGDPAAATTLERSFRQKAIRDALNNYCRELSERKMRIEFLDDDTPFRMQPLLEEEIYRVELECATNE